MPVPDVTFGHRAWRFWSDGMIDMTRVPAATGLVALGDLRGEPFTSGALRVSGEAVG